MVGSPGGNRGQTDMRGTDVFQPREMPSLSPRLWPELSRSPTDLTPVFPPPPRLDLPAGCPPVLSASRPAPLHLGLHIPLSRKSCSHIQSGLPSDQSRCPLLPGSCGPAVTSPFLPLPLMPPGPLPSPPHTSSLHRAGCCRLPASISGAWSQGDQYLLGLAWHGHLTQPPWS